MRFPIIRDPDEVGRAFGGAIVAIGNFDGMHRGHRAVIEAARVRAKALAAPALALTFEPHPRAFFQPAEPMFRLTDEESKLRLLATAGLDAAVCLPFDAALAQMSAEEFIEGVLVNRMRIAGAAVGFDFHFGRARGGSPAFLKEQGERLGFAVDVVSQLSNEGRAVSSSAIRAALSDGRVEDAADLLGYPWFVTGRVIHGEKRGRALGFPTANLKLDPACGLRHGIYAVRVGIGSMRYDGVASFGRRPTFDDGAPLLEVFLFDFTGDLYGKDLDVAFIGWIRPELKFDGADELMSRMNEDATQARALLNPAPDAFPPI